MYITMMNKNLPNPRDNSPPASQNRFRQLQRMPTNRHTIHTMRPQNIIRRHFRIQTSRSKLRRRHRITLISNRRLIRIHNRSRHRTTPIYTNARRSAQAHTMQGRQGLILNTMTSRYNSILLITQIRRRIQSDYRLTIPRDRVLIRNLTITMLSTTRIIIKGILYTSSHLSNNTIFQYSNNQHLRISQLITLAR